jgi:MFS transporter, Spinster family, sphingosine-1-phosphate transporter
MRSVAYKHYVLGVLSVVLLFNYVDRLALGLVLQDIKLEFHLTDTQLGLLSGFAFALFYSVMGIPIARWADRGNRVTIIALTTGLWSFAVALCGAAGSFVQLLLIRVAVGIGEAGCVPPALSLIASYFSRAERPQAVAFYYMGGTFSFVVGVFLAGWLNEFYGWRVTFMLLGAPGLGLAALAWFTLREPRTAGLISTPSSSSSSSSLSTQAQPSLMEVCATLWANVTFRHLLLCESILYFFGYGLAQWQPTFLMRSYGLTSGEIGTWMAVMGGVGGVLGTYLGGAWASRHAAGNERLQLKVISMAIATCGVLCAIMFLAHNQYLTWALIGLSSFALYGVSGPFIATIQTLVPERMRAMAFAIVYFAANLIGMGFGPLAAGALSDSFRSWAGEESLRFALLALTPGYLWAGWHAWRSSQCVARDLETTSGDVPPARFDGEMHASAKLSQ